VEEQHFTKKHEGINLAMSTNMASNFGVRRSARWKRRWKREKELSKKDQNLSKKGGSHRVEDERVHSIEVWWECRGRNVDPFKRSEGGLPHREGCV